MTTVTAAERSERAEEGEERTKEGAMIVTLPPPLCRSVGMNVVRAPLSLSQSVTASNWGDLIILGRKERHL